MKRVCIPLLLGSAAGALAQDPKPDLSALGIEDLMKIEVVTASRSGQSVMSVPAAVFVLTGEDIRRSGATTIPEMLIGIPGVQVSRIDGNKWMVSMRGFNGRFANKLQVLIDGQSIYSPLFSGVLWDDYSLDPDEIERIEVVRGPFGATWGANAVNGVINIITKKAAKTQGWTLQIGQGTALAETYRIRFGGELDEQMPFRVSGNLTRNDPLETANGDSAEDAWKVANLRFRLDSERGVDSWTLGGYYSESRFHSVFQFPTFESPFSMASMDSGTNRLGTLNFEWTRKASDSKTTSIRAGFSDSHREDPELPANRQTIDLEWRQDQSNRGKSRASYGVSFRQSSDRAFNSPFVQLSPKRRMDRLFGAFGHIEQPLKPGLMLHADAMLEHNDYTGFEFMPSLSVLWEKSDRESLWAALSRSVRSPSRSEVDSSIWLRTIPMEGLPPTALRLIGSDEFRAENLISFEMGWRYQASRTASYDVATFVSAYDNLRTFELQDPTMSTTPVPHIEQTAHFGNKLNALTAGIEVTARFNPNPDWKLTLGYSLFSDKFDLDDDSNDAFESNSSERQGSTARHSASLRSSHDLKGGWTFDLLGSYTGELPALGIRAGTRVDVRIAWSLRPDMELSLVGQNFLDRRRKEGDTSLFETVSYVPRGLYGMVTWRF